MSRLVWFGVGVVLGIAGVRNAAAMNAPTLAAVGLAFVAGCAVCWLGGNRAKAEAVAVAVAKATAIAQAASDAQAAAIAQAAVHLHMTGSDPSSLLALSSSAGEAQRQRADLPGGVGRLIANAPSLPASPGGQTSGVSLPVTKQP